MSISEVLERFHLTKSIWTQVLGVCMWIGEKCGAIFSSGEQNQRTVTALSAAGKTGDGWARVLHPTPLPAPSRWLSLCSHYNRRATSPMLITGPALQKFNHTDCWCQEFSISLVKFPCFSQVDKKSRLPLFLIKNTWEEDGPLLHFTTL